MRDSVALQRYLTRHREAGLPQPPAQNNTWDHVLVIPAYRESPALLGRLAALPCPGALLVILVVNRPDSEANNDCNRALLQACHRLPSELASPGSGYNLLRLAERRDLLLCELDANTGPLPAAQGVGLARKIGCDIALSWMEAGLIKTDWIASTDADAQLPTDYFERLEEIAPKRSAACFPFYHAPGPNDVCNRATRLYELRLHHYVLGLEAAESPYAHHTIGSCLAVRSEAYCQVRGFPKRSAGEDFYLLGKIAKVGRIERLHGAAVALESRFSDRVPFGTGPASARIAGGSSPEDMPLFYHPGSFLALGAVIQALPDLRDKELDALPALLEETLEAPLARASCRILDELGLRRALEHSRRQSRDAAQFLRQCHQWFDAFRTLKFIHGLRAAGWGELSFNELTNAQTSLWPTAEAPSPEAYHRAVTAHWRWDLPNS